MVGSQYVDEDVYLPRALGDTILELKDYTGQGFTGIDLEVKKGEVVAFTGLAGCGASELMQTMFGALPAQSGTMRVNGRNLEGSIVRFMKNGVAMLAANRKENSVVPDMSIMENFYLAEHELSGKKPFISKKTEDSRYAAQKESLHIKAGDSSDSILSLSGGNQQKVFLARWLNIGADVLLFDNPTQGVVPMGIGGGRGRQGGDLPADPGLCRGGQDRYHQHPGDSRDSEGGRPVRGVLRGTHCENLPPRPGQRARCYALLHQRRGNQ